MEAWKRDLCGVPSGSEWAGGDGRKVKELELGKMDTLIMEVSKMGRAVAEIRESVLCLEESISTEEKEQMELESELKSLITPLAGQQYSATEKNLQASTDLIRSQIEGEERQNEILQEELAVLTKKLADILESKRRKLMEIKDRYGGRLVGREEINKQRRLLELKCKKNMLTSTVMKLRKEQREKKDKEWSNFTKAVIEIAKLQNMIKNKNVDVQQHKASIQMLQITLHSKKVVDSPPDNSLVRECYQSDTLSLSSSPSIAAYVVTSPKTSSSPCVPTVQGQDHPHGKYSFKSLSLLKLPFTKFGNKKASRSPLRASGREVDLSVSKECPQIIKSLNFNQTQTQTQQTPHCCLQNNSQMTSSTEPIFTSVNCRDQNENKYNLWNQTSGVRNVSPTQVNTIYNLMSSKPISASIITPGNNQSFEASCPPDNGGSPMIPQSLKGLTSPCETLRISPQVYRGITMTSQKLRGVEPSLAKPKSAESFLPRGVQSPYIRRGVGTAQRLLSRGARVSAPIRGIGKASFKPLSLYTQRQYQSVSKRSQNSSEISGYSSTAKKHMTYQKQSPASADPQEDNSTASNSYTNGDHLFPKTSVPLDASPSDSLQGPSSNILPPAENAATLGSMFPNPMEVNDHQSLKVTSPIKASESKQDFVTESSTVQQTSYLPKDSQKGISSTIQVGFDCKKSTSAALSVPHVSTSLSSSTLSHSLTKKEKLSGQSNRTPSTPDVNRENSSQKLSTSTPASDGHFPFMFQNRSPVNRKENLQLNLFGSPVAESSTHESPAPGSSKNSGGNIFGLDSDVASRTESTSRALFNLNLGSDGESADKSESSFLSFLFDSSTNASRSPNESSGFQLF